jgi:predicted dehydrogenase
LSAIVDPGPAGPELAQKFGVGLYQAPAELFEKDKPDGVILATPNQRHVDGGLEPADRYGSEPLHRPPFC